MYVLGFAFFLKHWHEHLLFYHRQEYQDTHVLVNEELWRWWRPATIRHFKCCQALSSESPVPVCVRHSFWCVCVCRGGWKLHVIAPIEMSPAVYCIGAQVCLRAPLACFCLTPWKKEKSLFIHCWKPCQLSGWPWQVPRFIFLSAARVCVEQDQDNKSRSCCSVWENSKVHSYIQECWLIL